MSDASCDFETTSGADIKLGLARYFADAEADALCLGYRLPGEDVQCWVAGEDPNPWPLFDHVAGGGRIRAWNAAFEWAAWNLICVPKYGWPAVPIEQFVDTMAEAQAMNLPGALEKCGLALGLPIEKLKSQEGKNLIRKLCIPQKLTTNQPLRWLTPATHPELHAKLHAYCIQDVVAEESIAKKLRRLTDFEQRVWVLTQKINARGVPVDLAEVDNIHAVVTAEVEELNRELRKITKREVEKASNRGALLKWINAHPGLAGYDPVFFDDEDDEVEDHHGDYFPNLQKETVAKVLDRDHLPADVRRVLEIRQQVAQTATAKYPKLLKIAADDATLKNMHVYHGAGTGRWASRGGFNVQNLFRPTLSKLDLRTAQEALGHLSHEHCSLLFGERVMESAASCLRGVIKAPDGFEFIDADYSSVENRVASWLAGQDDKLAMFAEGLDEYKTFAAARLFNCAYDDVTPQQRQWTKPVILGGIFGLGAEGLLEYAENYGVKMTIEEARTAVKALRAEYDQVRSCWYACGDAAVSAVQNPGTWFQAGEKLKLIVYKNFLWMQLPSGRNICWAAPIVKMMECPWTERVVIGYELGPDPEGGRDIQVPVTEERPAMRLGVTVESVDTFTRQWKRHKLIGSSIFQSGVQGTARDVLANGLFHVEDAGYPVVMMVHDELMTLVPEGFGSPEELGALMCTAAPWMAGLPLATEGWRGERFRK